MSTSPYASLITFITITEIKLFGMYLPHTTTLGHAIKSFFNNYDCNNKQHLNIYSAELKTSINNLDSSCLMINFNFSKKTTFELKYEPHNG